MNKEETKKTAEAVDILIMKMLADMREAVKRCLNHEHSENELANLADYIQALTEYLQECRDKLVILSMKVKVELDEEMARGQ